MTHRERLRDIWNAWWSFARNQILQRKYHDPPGTIYQLAPPDYWDSASGTDDDAAQKIYVHEDTDDGF